MASGGPAVRSETKPPAITLSDFYSVKKRSTVRKIQKPYEEISAAAKAKGITVVKEMQERGYKDFDSFNKGCGQFPMTCWVTEFAELGSGYVLYFHFLTFVGLLLLVLFLLQLPVMKTYGDYNWLHGWQWSSWEAAFQSKDSCECIGDNNGITGLPGVQAQSNYGKSCAAWDAPTSIDTCQEGQDCKVSRPGQWMCQKWCFAAPHCPARFHEENPSASNVHYKGLVKSYSFCHSEEDQAAALQPCTGVTSENIAFAELGVDLGMDTYTIGSHWLTPGNLGPDQAIMAWIPTLYFVCVCLVCFMILVAYQRMVITDHKVDADNLLPNDFAILVRGFPKTATDEKQIMQWFADNAIPGKRTEIVKVVIGWDVEEFRQHLKQLQKLSARLKKVEPDSDEAVEIKKMQQDIATVLHSVAPDKAARLQSSGVNVVVFRHHFDMKAVVRRWNSFSARWLYSDSNGICPGSTLPLFPLGGKNVCKLKVQRAPNPGDINWEELAVPYGERMKMLMKTNFVMLLLIGATFIITYFMNILQKRTQEIANHIHGEKRFGMQAVSFLPATVVALMNVILAMAARALGKKEFHDTKTTEEFSQAMKMSWGMILNTMGVILFQNAQPKEWYMRGGLVENLGPMLLMNSLGQTLMPMFEMNYWMSHFYRRKLTSEKIAQMNETITSCVGKKDPESAKKLKQVKAQVQEWKTHFAPEVMDQPRRFAIALQICFCCIFFTPVMPWVPLVGLLGIVLQYWMDKYMLLRKYRRPEIPANANLVMFSLKFIKYFAPLGLTISAWLFLTPSYREKGLTMFFMQLSLAVAAAFSFAVPLRIWAKCLLGCCGEPVKTDDTDYYAAQYMWSKEMKYHKDQFIYKKLPDSVNPEYLKPGQSAAIRPKVCNVLSASLQDRRRQGDVWRCCDIRG